MCTFEKGKFEMVKMGSMTIGHASYEPGPKWSVLLILRQALLPARSNTSAWSFRLRCVSDE